MRLLSLIVLLSSLAFAQGQFSGGGGSGSGGTTITNTNVATNDVACWNGTNYVNCTPGQTQNVQSGTTYTILSTDNTKVIQLTNVAAKTITVPDATTAGFGTGFFVDVCNANTGAATFNRSSTNTIDGATSTSLAAASTMAPLCFRLNSDGSNWRTTGRGASSGSSSSLICSSQQQTGITGNGAAQNVSTCSIPGGTITTTNGIQIDACVQHTGTNSASFAMTYGASATYSNVISASTGTSIACVTVYLFDSSSTSAQQFSRMVYYGMGGAVGAAGTATGTTDSTATQTLSLTFTVASPDTVIPVMWVVRKIQ